MQCLNHALKAEGFDSSLKLPDKVLTFTRDHPLMENSVVSAPLLVRRGITYTKLAVTLSSVNDDDKRTAVVLHLGTGKTRKGRGKKIKFLNFFVLKIKC